jgi:hypothetical protein
MYQGYWTCLNTANRDGLLEYFSGERFFSNSAMQTVVQGKQELRKIAATWPPVVNVPDWHTIDGNRLVVSWKERPQDGLLATPYREASSFLLNDAGKITDYVGICNMQDVLEAFKS